jgi:hypothetical protein
MDKFLSICNLAICIIIIAILLHILGYVEIRVKNREGMSKQTGNALLGVAMGLFILGFLLKIFGVIPDSRSVRRA